MIEKKKELLYPSQPCTEKEARLTSHLSRCLFIHHRLNRFPAVHVFTSEIVVNASLPSEGGTMSQ